VAGSSRFRRLAGSIITTGGSPDRRLAPDQPLRVRVIQRAPAGHVAVQAPVSVSFSTGSCAQPLETRAQVTLTLLIGASEYEQAGPMGFLTRTSFHYLRRIQ
jgi:hypothetical protein